MTDTTRLAKGWALIAEGAMEISLAFDSPAAAAVPAPSLAVPSFEELPPEGFLEEAAREVAKPEPPPLKPQVDAGLGKCPVHGKPWTIKAGGVSKAGKPYKAFWKCSEKDGDTFCNEKPQRIWSDTHPAEAAA